MRVANFWWIVPGLRVCMLFEYEEAVCEGEMELRIILNECKAMGANSFYIAGDFNMEL